MGELYTSKKIHRLNSLHKTDEIFDSILRSVSQIKTVEQLSEKFHEAMAVFDLDQYTYQVVEHQALHNLKNYFLTTYPKEWENHYIKKDYFKSDPLVHQFTTSNSSFMWDDQTFGESPKEAKKMLLESSDFNLHNGIGIPIPGPNKSFSILTLCSKESNGKELRNVYKHFHKDLMIFSLTFHNAFLSLNLDNQLYPTYELTNKELECLKWMCAGKSNGDIAAILGVSINAIKERTGNIYRKMGARDRIEAVLIAHRHKMLRE